MLRNIFLLLILSAAAWPHVRVSAAPAAAEPERSLRETMEEIGLLQQLRMLRLSREQLTGWRQAAGEVQAERAKAEARAETPEFRAAAEAVRKALLEGRAEDELNPLFEKLEQLLQQARGGDEGEPELRIAAVVRASARRLIEGLRADQIVRLVGEEEGEDGIGQVLLREIGEMRRQPEEARRRYTADQSRRLSLELTTDVARAGLARAELEKLITASLMLTEAELTARREAITREIAGIVSRAVNSPLGEIQLRAERRVAGILRHPRAAAVLTARLAAAG